MKKMIFLDDEEKELYEDIEKYGVHPTENSAEEIKMFQVAAKAYMAKNKSINIRMTAQDISSLKSRALAAGMPYQTLATAVLRQYIGGKVQITL